MYIESEESINLGRKTVPTKTVWLSASLQTDWSP